MERDDRNTLVSVRTCAALRLTHLNYLNEDDLCLIDIVKVDP